MGVINVRFCIVILCVAVAVAPSYFRKVPNFLLKTDSGWKWKHRQKNLFKSYLFPNVSKSSSLAKNV